MAHHITHTMRAEISVERIWHVLSDFSSIERTSHSVESSPIISDIKSGVGTKRKCYFYDKKSVVEEIIEYQEGHGFKMCLSEYSAPMKSIMAEFRIDKVSENSCDITMSMDFVVKAGPIGWLLGVLLLKPILKKKVLKSELLGLAYHVITGNLVDQTLPTYKELASLTR